jgi:hypothetical protein
VVPVEGVEQERERVARLEEGKGTAAVLPFRFDGR